MIHEIKARQTELYASKGEPLVLEFTETGNNHVKIRVIINEKILVALEQQLKEGIDLLQLDREKLLRDINLTSWKHDGRG